MIQRLLNILRNTSHLTATIPQLQLVEALTSLLVWVESPGEDKMDVDNNEQNPATYFDTFILVATSQPTIGALHSKVHRFSCKQLKLLTECTCRLGIGTLVYYIDYETLKSFRESQDCCIVLRYSSDKQS